MLKPAYRFVQPGWEVRVHIFANAKMVLRTAFAPDTRKVSGVRLPHQHQPQNTFVVHASACQRQAKACTANYRTTAIRLISI